MNSLQQTLVLEDIKNVTLLPEEYDDAFIGIDELSTNKAVYSSDLLDRISKREEWMDVWENVATVRKRPVVMEYRYSYDETDISDILNGAIIGMSMDGKKIVVSHAKLLEEIINSEECSEDEATDMIEELKDDLKSEKKKNILLIGGIDGYDDMYNVLSFQNYEIDEDISEEDEYDDTELLKEIGKSIKLR